MGSKTWKKIEQSSAAQKAKLKWKQLVGREPVFRPDIKLKTEDYFGWQLVPGMLQPGDRLYSLGICDDINFELAAIENFDVEVFAFDPTPYSVRWIEQQSLPEKFNFYPWAGAGSDGEFFLYPRVDSKGRKSEVMYSFHEQQQALEDGVKVKALSLPSMAAQLGHDRIDVLKMDVEGAEYGVLKSLHLSSLRPRMLLIEFHHRFAGLSKEQTIAAVEALRAQGYQVVSVSDTGREICFVHQSAA